MRRDSAIIRRFLGRATVAYSRSKKMFLTERGFTSHMEKALILSLSEWMDRAEQRMSLSDSYTLDFYILK